MNVTATVDTLLIASAAPELDALCAALDAEKADAPIFQARSDEDFDLWPWAESYDRWRSATSEGERFPGVVVAAWNEEAARSTPLIDLDYGEWLRRHEEPVARWFTALGAAAKRCEDGGSIVAVIERSAPLDCAGRAAETALSDAVEAMVRSLARSEGKRDVRVNAVTTSIRLVPERLVEPAPTLARYPGTMDADVAGAVLFLLGDSAVGITGSILDADSGRSWR